MTQPAHQEPLFPEPYQPVIKVTRKETSTERPRWSRYKPASPVKCDDCMLILALAKGNAPASKFAHWKRKRGDSFLLLCYAEARREEDGLEPLKGESPARRR